MKIAIDARALSHPQPGGFKTYTTNLVCTLLAEYPANEYILYLDRPLSKNMFDGYANVSQEVVHSAAGWVGMPLREQILLPLRLHYQRPDVVHFPCATGPILPPCPIVVTIHDTIEFFETPSLARPLRESLRRVLMANYNRRVQSVVARRANMVITVSQHAKADIIRVLKIPDSKISVVPEAPPVVYHPKRNPETLRVLRGRYGLPGSFVLALASASPRKNALGLLRIYGRLPHTLCSSYPLVIVWTHPLLQAAIKRDVVQLGLADYVHFLSRISEEDLALLYNAATLFVFPSLYEGFGLPVLEAMACGTPVVASNRTSVPEVAGNAAKLADPLDEDAFAQALVDVLSSPEQQAALAEAGLRRARQFSWRNTAKQTLEVYQHVIRSRL